MYISVTDLAHFLIFTLAILIGIFMVVLLLNIIKFFKNLNYIVTDNNQNINQILSTLPEILNNVNDITLEVSDSAQKVNKSIAFSEEILIGLVESIGSSKAGFFGIVGIVSDFIKFIVNLFNKNSNKE